MGEQQLLQKIFEEIQTMNKRLENVEKLTSTIPDIERRTSRIPSIENDIQELKKVTNDIPAMKQAIFETNEIVKSIEAKVDEKDSEIQVINKRLFHVESKIERLSQSQ